MQESSPTSRETVRVLAALSDENRFRIVELLANADDELSCGAIGKALDMSPSLLSHHLAILAEAEIIARRKNGLWTMNVLQRAVIERQVDTLRSLIGPGGNGKRDALTRLRLDGAADSPRPPTAYDGPSGDEAVAGP
ncbi:MAG: ArsR/SmtB family transcription factor [Gemmatimonadota bacterium]